MSLNSSTLLNEGNAQGAKRNTECLESLLQSPSSIQDNPLQQLQLASQEVLEKAKKSGRSKCPRCNSSRMFYCYTCFVPVETVPTKEIPTVKLPLKIDIIKHPNETDGKSTAVHAKLLAPDDVTIYKYPCIPEYEEKRHEIALIFPGPNSVSVKDIAFHLQKYTKKSVCSSDDDCFRDPLPKQAKIEPEEEKNPNECISSSRSEGTRLKKIIFIDSTWNQTNKIITDERLQGLLQIELKTRKTCFWRHQKGTPDTYLSTIEAIYYFLVDYHQEILKESYKGQYDNLLFFFSFMYTLIKDAKCCAGKKPDVLTVMSTFPEMGVEDLTPLAGWLCFPGAWQPEKNERRMFGCTISLSSARVLQVTEGHEPKEFNALLHGEQYDLGQP
ncbi:tRNA-uridine aminocarboxypropyltransferase 1 isoform 2-T2 [Ammospiza maritima maritima]